MRRFCLPLAALGLMVSCCQVAIAGVSGKVIDRFEPKVTPEDPKLVEAVEKALAEKADK